MRWILFALFMGLCVGGIGMMAYGYRVNRLKGSKRYHPGNRWVNIGLLGIILGGMSLALLGWSSLVE